MSLLFKLHKTLVTFSLTLTFKVGYFIFQNFWKMQKGTWYQKTFEEYLEIRKIKTHRWTVWLRTCSLAFFSLLKTSKKEKVQMTQRNEMLSLYCTACGFISKNEYNPE